MPGFRSTQSSERDVLSLESLFAALEKPLLIYAFKITEGQEAAQDVVQEAFLRLQKSIEDVQSPKAWLYRTVHNLAISLSKRESRLTPIDEEDQTDYSDLEVVESKLPREELERVEMLGIARALIDKLDTKSRTVVRMKFDQSLSYKEISQKTGLTVSNVGYILHQAVSSLSSEFKRMGLGR
jgi:RNA polymerase sigma-70 factor (ECF subfamily)